MSEMSTTVPCQCPNCGHLITIETKTTMVIKLTETKLVTDVLRAPQVLEPAPISIPPGILASTPAAELPSSLNELYRMGPMAQGLALVELRAKYDTIEAVSKVLSCSTTTVENICRRNGVTKAVVDEYIAKHPKTASASDDLPIGQPGKTLHMPHRQWSEMSITDKKIAIDQLKAEEPTITQAKIAKILSCHDTSVSYFLKHTAPRVIGDSIPLPSEAVKSGIQVTEEVYPKWKMMADAEKIEALKYMDGHRISTKLIAKKYHTGIQVIRKARKRFADQLPKFNFGNRAATATPEVKPMTQDEKIEYLARRTNTTKNEVRTLMLDYPIMAAGLMDRPDTNDMWTDWKVQQVAIKRAPTNIVKQVDAATMRTRGFIYFHELAPKLHRSRNWYERRFRNDQLPAVFRGRQVWLDADAVRCLMEADSVGFCDVPKTSVDAKDLADEGALHISTLHKELEIPYSRLIDEAHKRNAVIFMGPCGTSKRKVACINSEIWDPRKDPDFNQKLKTDSDNSEGETK